MFGMALFFQMPSVSWEDIGCSCVKWQECKAKRERKCGLIAPHPTNVSYLWELMSDGLTWDHPWQIEMTPQTFPESKPSKRSAFHFSQPKKYTHKWFGDTSHKKSSSFWISLVWCRLVAEFVALRMWQIKHRSSWFELFSGKNMDSRKMSWNMWMQKSLI